MSDSDHVARAFGQALHEARVKTALSQEELAHRSDVHRTQISQLELGKRLPRLDTLIKIAGALGVEPCALVTDVRWAPPEVGPQQGGFR